MLTGSKLTHLVEVSSVRALWAPHCGGSSLMHHSTAAVSKQMGALYVYVQRGSVPHFVCGLTSLMKL